MNSSYYPNGHPIRYIKDQLKEHIGCDDEIVRIATNIVVNLKIPTTSEELREIKARLASQIRGESWVDILDTEFDSIFEAAIVGTLSGEHVRSDGFYRASCVHQLLEDLWKSEVAPKCGECEERVNWFLEIYVVRNQSKRSDRPYVGPHAQVSLSELGPFRSVG